MIDVKELRIGNLLKEGKVKSLYYDGKVGLDTGFSHGAEILNGIELTEEWLLKFSFRKETAEAKGIETWDYYVLNIFELHPYRSFFKFISSIGVTEIKFVHELQNLYHSLTGTELTINKSQTE